MRILCIRGSNLASLATPFEVALDSGPLGGTGLFAVVGETGAGKSTILDAVCLALYGECPRIVGDGDAAEVPDVDHLAGDDPRTVLRRGAATGFAEVDFIGADGESYRATWRVRRARDKDSGRLQKVERTLARISDGQGIAQGIEQTRSEIERRVGLTFDQFRRTVLLAQGDFDAFLRADDKNRADLLEKVTGTEVYGRVSKAVHEAAKEKARAADLLHQRLLGIGALHSQAREQLEADLAQASSECAQTKLNRDALHADLELVRRASASVLAKTEATQQLESANSAWTAAEEDRRRAALLEAIEKISPLLRSEASERVLLNLALVDLKQAETHLAVASTAAETQDEAASSARFALEEIEVVYKRFGPVWDEAAELDARLREAIKGRDAANHAATESERQLEAANIRLTELSQQVSIKTGEMSVFVEEQGAAGDLSGFAARANEIETEIEDWLKASVEAEAAVTSATELRTELDQLEKTSSERIAGLAEADKLVADREVECRQAEEALAGADEEAVEQRGARLEAAVRALDTGLQAIETCSRASSQREDAQRQYDATEQRATEAAARRLSLEEQRSSLEAERRAAARFQILADEEVQHTAARIRDSLVEDEPCPVCGSRAHPFADDHGAIGELAAKQRAEVERLAGEQVRAETELEAAAKAVDEIRNEQARLASALRSANLDIGTGEAAWARSRGDVLQIADELELTVELPVLALDSEAHVRARHCREVVARDLESSRATLVQLRRRRAVREESAAKLRTAEAEARTARGDASRAMADLTKARLSEASTMAAHDSRIRRATECAQRIAPVATALGLSSEEWRADPKTAAETVRTGLAAWLERDRQIRVLTAAVQELETSAKQASTLIEERSGALRVASEKANAALAHLNRLQLERAAILDGEPTGDHRTRINDARRAALKADQDAKDAIVIAKVALEGARVRVAKASQDKVAIEERLATATAQVNSALPELGLDRAVVEVLSAATPDERLSLVERLRILDLAVHDAQTLLDLRTREHDAASEAAASLSPRDELESAFVKVNVAFEAAMKLEGERLALVRADEERRKASADVQDQIIVADRERAEHGAVSEAIGSADGSRFRRIAQRITLRTLIHSANSQLIVLAPRYQLAPTTTEGLGLLVIDRDMAGERRATRSLSGGERFLVSLALALALSGLRGGGAFVQTLFIDEGFGSLDPQSLDVVVDALEALQSGGRQVGVISHVPAMIDRIAVQVRVEKQGGGRSKLVTIG